MIAIWYIFFAMIAMGINIGLQYISFYFYNGFLALYVAMFIGTLGGLVTKYLLDKNYIFFDISKNKREDGKKFLLYSFFGIFTTLIFWGCEIVFYHTFESEMAKYIGALIGLGIGYVVKYFLDKKFVFKESHATQ